MSQWTHVVGVIQLDPVTQEEVENALGVPKTWNDMVNRTKRYCRHLQSSVDIPTGSEGTIVWHLQDTTEKTKEDDSWNILGEGSIISIEGDLRNFGEYDEDVQEIAKWFIKGCKKLGSPRWATLSIEVEFGNSYIIDVMWDRCIIQKFDRNQTLTVEELVAHERK